MRPARCRRSDRPSRPRRAPASARRTHRSARHPPWTLGRRRRPRIREPTTTARAERSWPSSTSLAATDANENLRKTAAKSKARPDDYPPEPCPRGMCGQSLGVGASQLSRTRNHPGFGVVGGLGEGEEEHVMKKFSLIAASVVALGWTAAHAETGASAGAGVSGEGAGANANVGAGSDTPSAADSVNAPANGSANGNLKVQGPNTTVTAPGGSSATI